MKSRFCYIGPDKSGSTWLFEQFMKHPGIFVPEAKDLYFFDKNYHRGLGWYESFFNRCSERMIGEISHDYLFSKLSIERIHSNYPDIKLLSILRNPIDKIWSHYLFLIRSGITTSSFEDALTEFPELIEKSLYSEGIKQCLDLFDINQVGVFYFDDLIENPGMLLREIYKFLDVEILINDSVAENPLPASKPRYFILAKMAKKSANVLRSFGFENTLGKIKRNTIIKNILYKRLDKKPFMDSQTKRYLLDNFLLKDIEKLEKYLSVDLIHWKI